MRYGPSFEQGEFFNIRARNLSANAAAAKSNSSPADGFETQQNTPITCPVERVAKCQLEPWKIIRRRPLIVASVIRISHLGPTVEKTQSLGTNVQVVSAYIVQQTASVAIKENILAQVLGIEYLTFTKPISTKNNSLTITSFSRR